MIRRIRLKAFPSASHGSNRGFKVRVQAEPDSIDGGTQPACFDDMWADSRQAEDIGGQLHSGVAAYSLTI